MKKTILACAVTACAVGGTTATAASLITSSQIKDGTVQARDIKKGSITGNRLSPGLQRQLARAIAQSGGAVPVGLAGANGAPGVAGANGAPGAKGEDGINGRNGTNGVAGKDGADGATGADGNDGKDGLNGQNGDGTFTRSVSSFGTGAQDVKDGDTGSGESTFVPDALRLVRGNTPGFARASFPFPSGAKVGQIEALAYKFAVADRAAGSKVAPALKMTVTGAVPCAAGASCPNPASSTSGFTTLVFEPTYFVGKDGISSGTLDALSPDARWWSTRGIEGAENPDVRRPLAELVASNPNMTITSVTVEAGDSGAAFNGFDGSVDFVNLGFAGADATRYDFGS